MYTIYVLNPISLSHYPTPCPPLYLPLATILSSPPPDDIHCQVCQSLFDEHKMLLCEICNAAWYMDCFLPSLTATPHGTWKCPSSIPRHLAPQTATRHLRLPTPISISTLIKISKKKNLNCQFWLKKYDDSKSLIRVSRPLTTIYQKKIKKKFFFKHGHPNSGPTPTCTPIMRGLGL